MNKALANALRRMGIDASEVRTPQVQIGTQRLTASRTAIAGMPWLHFCGASTQIPDKIAYRTNLVASLTDRVPAVGVLTGDELTYVRLPGWAFAAILRMVAECPTDTVTTVLNEYRPLAMTLPPSEMAIGSSILSALEGTAPSWPSTSDTDSTSTRSQTP